MAGLATNPIYCSDPPCGISAIASGSRKHHSIGSKKERKTDLANCYHLLFHLEYGLYLLGFQLFECSHARLACNSDCTDPFLSGCSTDDTCFLALLPTEIDNRQDLELCRIDLLLDRI